MGGGDEALGALEVRPDRMRANLDAAGGLLLAERIVLALAPRAGRDAAKAAVQAAAAEAAGPASAGAGPGATRFRDALLAQPVVAAHLDATALDALLDPAGYLGATHVFIERALARAERELPA